MQIDDDPRGLGTAFAEARAESGGFADELAAATRAMREMDAEAKRLSRSLGSSLRSAIDRAIFGGEKLTEVLRNLASDVVGRSLDAALRPVEDALASGISGAVGSLSGALASAFTAADGAAFSAGRVRAFARGGVVNRPTLFPMRSGLGLMGEAGPEAVMPLSRGADGRLGVSAEGAGAPVVNVTIQAQDARSFERSRGQVAAQLARAVRRGSQRL